MLFTWAGLGTPRHAGARQNGGPLPPTSHPTHANAPENNSFNQNHFKNCCSRPPLAIFVSFLSFLLSHSYSKCFFSYLGPSWCRFLPSKRPLRPSKTLISLRRGLDFRKTKVGDLKMLFRVFGGSLWLLFGAPGGVLGALLVLLGAPGGTPTSPNFSFGHP